MTHQYIILVINACNCETNLCTVITVLFIAEILITANYYCIYLKIMFKCCLQSCLVSQVSLLPLGISSSSFKGQIWKPGRPGGDLPLAMLTKLINSLKSVHLSRQNLQKLPKITMTTLLICQNLSKPIKSN